MADDRSTRRHLATVFVAMWSRVQEWSRGRGLTWIDKAYEVKSG